MTADDLVLYMYVYLFIHDNKIKLIYKAERYNWNINIRYFAYLVYGNFRCFVPGNIMDEITLMCNKCMYMVENIEI